MTAETWRVVTDDGVREVVVELLCDWGASRQYRVEGVLLVARCARVAVGRWASRDDGEAVPLGVREVVAPGDLTRAEAVAAETARCRSIVREQVETTHDWSVRDDRRRGTRGTQRTGGEPARPAALVAPRRDRRPVRVAGAPVTPAALRAAVARVLVARGEAPDALVVVVEPWPPCIGVSVSITVCGVAVEWLYACEPTREEACAAAWGSLRHCLRCEFDAAKRSAAGTRRPERRATAQERLRRARAALAAAQETP